MGTEILWICGYRNCVGSLPMAARCALVLLLTAWKCESEALGALLKRVSGAHRTLLSASSWLPASSLKLSPACPTDEYNQQFSSDYVEQLCLCFTSALPPTAHFLSYKETLATWAENNKMRMQSVAALIWHRAQLLLIISWHHSPLELFVGFVEFSCMRLAKLLA